MAAARVVVGSISRETCTYADVATGLTTLDDFFSQQSGAEVLAANRGASTVVARPSRCVAVRWCTAARAAAAAHILRV